jgi:hypothetical protein
MAGGTSTVSVVCLRGYFVNCIDPDSINDGFLVARGGNPYRLNFGAISCALGVALVGLRICLSIALVDSQLHRDEEVNAAWWSGCGQSQWRLLR